MNFKNIILMKKLLLIQCFLFSCNLFLIAQTDLQLIYPNFKKREEWLLDSIKLRNVFEIIIKPNQLILHEGDTIGGCGCDLM